MSILHLQHISVHLLATFQGLNSHIWLVAVIPDNAVLNSFFLTKACCTSQQGFRQPVLGFVPLQASLKPVLDGWQGSYLRSEAPGEERSRVFFVCLFLCLISDLASAMHIVYDAMISEWMSKWMTKYHYGLLAGLRGKKKNRAGERNTHYPNFKLDLVLKYLHSLFLISSFNLTWHCLL